MTGQGPGYDPENKVSRVGNFPGARVEKDVIAVRLEEAIPLAAGQPLTQTIVDAIADSTEESGSNEAAELRLGEFRHQAQVIIQPIEETTVTVEVKVDNGSAWVHHDEQTFDDEGTWMVETMAQQVRAYADSDIESLELASKASL